MNVIVAQQVPAGNFELTVHMPDLEAKQVMMATPNVSFTQKSKKTWVYEMNPVAYVPDHYRIRTQTGIPYELAAGDTLTLSL